LFLFWLSPLLPLLRPPRVGLFCARFRLPSSPSTPIPFVRRFQSDSCFFFSSFFCILTSFPHATVSLRWCPFFVLLVFLASLTKTFFFFLSVFFYSVSPIHFFSLYFGEFFPELCFFCLVFFLYFFFLRFLARFSSAGASFCRRDCRSPP